MLNFIKNLFSKKEEAIIENPILSTQRVAKAGRFVGYPEDIERWEHEENIEIDSNFLNAQNELKDFLLLYQVHPWIFSSVSAIATAAASVEHRVVNQDKEEQKEESICKTLCRPNPHMVWFELMELSMCYLELTGNVFWEEVKDDKGNLIAIYPLRPDKVRILPHPKTKVAGYIYEPRPGTHILFGKDDITHIKYASPLDEYWGISPAYAAQNSVILDFNATTYNKKFFTNSAVPEGVLQTENTLSDEAYRRLRLSWLKRHRGNKNAFELGILEEGLKYVPIGFNQRDMQMVEMKELSREEILSTFRVPPVMVGLLKFASYATTREQRKMFWMDNILPKLEKIKQIVNENLMPGRLRLEFITEGINSIIEDVQISTQVSMSLVSHGIMTINEVRKKYYAMEPVEWGNQPWMPVGLAQPQSHPQNRIASEIEEEEDIPSGRIPEDGQQAINQSTPMGGSLPRSKSVDFEKMVAPEPDWNDIKKVRDWKVWSVWKGLATPDFVELKRMFGKFFEEQLNRVLPTIRANFKDKPVDKGAITKIIEDTYDEPYEIYKDDKFSPEIERMLFSIKEENGKLEARLIPKAKKILRKHGNFIIGDIGSSISFDIGSKNVEKFLKKNAGDQIRWINETTRKKLGRALAKAQSKGEGFQDVMTRINNIFKGTISEDRARRIARTETVTLTQFARQEGALQSGVVKKKRWVTAFFNSRDSHIDVHDTTIDIDKSFEVQNRSGGFDSMDGPGDPIASPENLVFCTCVLDFTGTTEEFGDIEGDVPGERR